MTSRASASRAAVWAGLFAISLAAVVGLKLAGAIDGTTGLLLFAFAMVPLALCLRAAGRARACAVNSAIRRYNRRMLASGLGYLLGLGIASMLHQAYAPGPALSFVLALLPTLPIFGMIAAMARYLIEESDEYLRYRTVIAALAGLGFVLGLGSFWGFLEEFAIVPHAPGWWAVPVWALGLGLAQAIMAMREPAGDEA